MRINIHLYKLSYIFINYQIKRTWKTMQISASPLKKIDVGSAMLIHLIF